MTVDIAFKTMTELAEGLATKQFSSQEVAQHYLSRISKANKKLHAYVSVDEDMTLAMARAADDRRAKGISLSAFDGVPFAAKDLCELTGHVTTAGSQAWLDRRSETDCTALMKLLRSGMVMLGKTHMVEFAFGGWGTNPVMGTPWNPWDLNTHRVPGGSSSGSGVAVAAGLAPAAIGSDTGGSVRIPSALNGLTGLKTTHGLISLHGAVSLSTSLDTIGPMAHSALDAGAWTALMAGPDPLDPGSLNRPAFKWHGDEPLEKQPLAGVGLAVLPASQYPMPIDEASSKAFDDACKVLTSLGAHLTELALPFDFDDLMKRNGQIIAAEAFAIHESYIDDPKLPLGPAVRERIQSGRAISAGQYVRALAHHGACSTQWGALMQNHTALLTPAIPFPAIAVADVDERQTPMASFARAGNYLTTCGLVLPAGLNNAGLPLSVQLLGKAFSEADLLRIGVAFQHVTHWHRAKPDLSGLGL